MNRKIRRNVFEANSSSVYTLTICTKEAEAAIPWVKEDIERLKRCESWEARKWTKET